MDHFRTVSPHMLRRVVARLCRAGHCYVCTKLQKRSVFYMNFNFKFNFFNHNLSHDTLCQEPCNQGELVHPHGLPESRGTSDYRQPTQSTALPSVISSYLLGRKFPLPQNPKFPQKNTQNTKKHIKNCIEFTPQICVPLRTWSLELTLGPSMHASDDLPSDLQWLTQPDTHLSLQSTNPPSLTDLPTCPSITVAEGNQVAVSIPVPVSRYIKSHIIYLFIY